MEKQLYDLKVDPEMSKVTRPLDKTERNLLKVDIQKNGCIFPIIVWNGFIVDGHNRYEICHELGIPFAIEEMEFENKTEAIMWIIRNQLGRRNMKPFERCEMVIPFEDDIKAEIERQRKERISATKNGKDTVAPGNPDVRSRDILAEMAGVSTSTFRRVKVILDLADEDTKDKLRKDEIGIKPVFNKLTGKDKPREKSHLSKQEPSTDNEKPNVLLDEPLEVSIEQPDPERVARPYQFVRQQVEYSIKNMIRDMQIGLNWLGNEDFGKKEELKQMVKDGYEYAARIIDEWEEM